MNLKKRIAVFCLALVLGGPVLLSQAQAGPLEDAKAAGYLGEQANGYLGVVSSSAPAQAVSLAKEINLKRRAKYREIAEKNQTTLKAVEAVVGQKLISRANPGEFVQPAGSGWQRK